MKTFQVEVSDEMYEQMEEYEKIVNIPINEQIQLAMKHYLNFFMENKGVY